MSQIKSIIYYINSDGYNDQNSTFQLQKLQEMLRLTKKQVLLLFILHASVPEDGFEERSSLSS